MTNNLMTTFLALCDPFREEIPGDISEDSWTHISELSKLHGVTPFLFYRVRSLEIPVPDKIMKEWLEIYLYQIAQEKKARQQIKELKEILGPEGIPFILLKGASAMLRLYPQPGLRTFVDLDILIPADRVSQFKKTMTRAGYKPLSARNSPEDEEIQKYDSHLDPLWKEGGFMIEAHLNVLGVKGDPSVSNPDVWQGKEETSIDGANIKHLNIEHFLIHTMFHFSRHLSGEGFAEIKWFIDLLDALKRWRIDWSKVRDVARKWGVEKDVFPVMATLNQYWETRIPLPIASEPIALNTLVLGIKDREKEYYANLPTSYMKRLFSFKQLPDAKSRLSYLFHLFFPTPENLRFRYSVSSEKSLVIYYFLHNILTAKIFLIGLWHQLSYHSQ